LNVGIMPRSIVPADCRLPSWQNVSNDIRLARFDPRLVNAGIRTDYLDVLITRTGFLGHALPISPCDGERIHAVRYNSVLQAEIFSRDGIRHGVTSILYIGDFQRTPHQSYFDCIDPEVNCPDPCGQRFSEGRLSRARPAC
jgi:hypothetical protein